MSSLSLFDNHFFNNSYSCGLKKLIPLKQSQRFMIHHFFTGRHPARNFVHEELESLTTNETYLSVCDRNVA